MTQRLPTQTVATLFIIIKKASLGLSCDRRVILENYRIDIAATSFFDIAATFPEMLLARFRLLCDLLLLMAPLDHRCKCQHDVFLPVAY